MDNINSKDKFIVLGYGDVGTNIIKVLEDNNVYFVVVDRNPDVFEKVRFKYIIGNGADEAILKAAGVLNASSIIITLNDDIDIIFATLICRNLNPDITIIARANTVRSIDKIYKAGADYVVSLSIIAGQMLSKMTSLCIDRVCENISEDIMLYEGIEIEKHQVHNQSPLKNRPVSEIENKYAIDCRVIGIKKKDKIITQINPSIIVEPGDLIAVVGSRESIAELKNKLTVAK